MISRKVTETIDQLLALTCIPPNTIFIFSNTLLRFWLLIISKICEKSCSNYFMGRNDIWIVASLEFHLHSKTIQQAKGWCIKPLSNHFIFAYFLFYLLTKMLMFVICFCCSWCCCCYCYYILPSAVLISNTFYKIILCIYTLKVLITVPIINIKERFVQ